jgi:hypothetical protein
VFDGRVEAVHEPEEKRVTTDARVQACRISFQVNQHRD